MPSVVPAPAAAAAGTDPDHLLRRELGVRQLAAIIFNYTVGSGIFALPAVAAAALGPAAILAYLVCAVVMALMVACFAEAGSRVSVTGGPYAYVDAAFGPYPGFVAGSLYLVKIVPLVGFVALGAFFVRPANLAWPSMPPPGSVVGASGVLIFAFVGIESALVVGGEIRNTSRTVPRAVFLALGAVTILYLAVQAVAQGLLGSALADDRVTPLATAMAVAIGPAGRIAMLAAAAVSTFGYLSGCILGGPRCLFAFARDGLAPRPLARVHPSYRTPHVAIVAYAAIAWLLVATTGRADAAAVAVTLAIATAFFLLRTWRRRGVLD